MGDGKYKVFRIKSLGDIDYAVSLIEQAYQCICKSKANRDKKI